MNGPCTLHQVRIRVSPDARRPVQLRYPGQFGLAIGLQREDLRGRGYVTGIPTADKWLLLQHPRLTNALVGLPIGSSSEEKGTWRSAWDDELIELDVCCPSGWERVDDWNMLAPLLANS